MVAHDRGSSDGGRAKRERERGPAGEIARFILDNWVRESQPMAMLAVELIRRGAKQSARWE